MAKQVPDAVLTSVVWHWGVYYTAAVQAAIDGTWTADNYFKGMNEKLLGLTELTSLCAEGTQEKVDELWAAIDDGSLKVFDTSKWTVNGETITSTANIDGYNGVEYISPDGYFMESELASAPSFNFIVDGITELNTVY